MIDTIRRTQRNVKRWYDGHMVLRWTAAGMLEAEQQSRKMIGYAQLPQLAIAIKRRLPAPPQPDTVQTKEAAIITAAQSPATGPPPRFHAARDNLPTRRSPLCQNAFPCSRILSTRT